MRHRLALVACLVFTGSIVPPASAERGDRRSKVSKKAKREGKQAKRQVEVARLEAREHEIYVHDGDDDRDPRIDRPARRPRASARRKRNHKTNARVLYRRQHFGGIFYRDRQ